MRLAACFTNTKGGKRGINKGKVGLAGSAGDRCWNGFTEATLFSWATDTVQWPSTGLMYVKPGVLNNRRMDRRKKGRWDSHSFIYA